MEVEIGIPEAARKEVGEALARLLADTHALYLKTHMYHWNVTGPRFRELHLMFEEQYRELWEATDEIAERIRMLGSWAPGTLTEFSRMTSVAQDEHVPPAEEMIRALLEGHQTVLRIAREALGVAERAADHGTVDLLTARIAAHEKTAWMLAASE